jgi:hypothetical protein
VLRSRNWLVRRGWPGCPDDRGLQAAARLRHGRDDNLGEPGRQQLSAVFSRGNGPGGAAGLLLSCGPQLRAASSSAITSLIPSRPPGRSTRNAPASTIFTACSLNSGV